MGILNWVCNPSCCALETLTVTPVGGHEDRKVDVRVLAATRPDIRKMVAANLSRKDCIYRLGTPLTLDVPPLRQRPMTYRCWSNTFSSR